MLTEGLCEKIVDNCIAKFGRIDILFNNAGFTIFGLLSDQPIKTYDTIFDVNLKSTIRLTKLCIPYLRETKGNIVNNSSVLATTPVENMGFYCMSKAALDMFTKCIALEEGKNGIRANNVNPGKKRSAITNNVISEISWKRSVFRIDNTSELLTRHIFLDFSLKNCEISCMPCGISQKMKEKSRLKG